MSDRLVLGAFQAAEQLALRVPEDLSVVGFDAIPLAAQLRPSSLTVIHQPLGERKHRCRITNGNDLPLPRTGYSLGGA
jgi:DNA-binding LacI/PurR family transcriptional regulator